MGGRAGMDGPELMARDDAFLWGLKVAFTEN
jgi:hypothetical protein